MTGPTRNNYRQNTVTVTPVHLWVNPDEPLANCFGIEFANNPQESRPENSPISNYPHKSLPIPPMSQNVAC